MRKWGDRMKSPRKKWTTIDMKNLRNNQEPIVMVTAYDASQAAHAEAAGVDVILVGDSLGMVVLGYDSTLPVTLSDMLHHAKAVRRGSPHTMMIVDMPFLTYRQTVADTVRNAGILMQEGLADAVKLEGGTSILPHVQALIESGIPVCGHLGLTPQSVLQMGGYRVQGRDPAVAQKLLEDAQLLEQTGAFMIVLEGIPSPLAKTVTTALQVPTIGIGAGISVSGQVLVYHDLLGLNAGHVPKFVKQYALLHEEAVSALSHYKEDVKTGNFPTPEFSYDMD